MNKMDYETVERLEKMGVAREYIVGWASGYLRNPPREEQRVTPAYLCGYEDGANHTTARAADWKTG